MSDCQSSFPTSSGNRSEMSLDLKVAVIGGGVMALVALAGLILKRLDRIIELLERQRADR